MCAYVPEKDSPLKNRIFRRVADTLSGKISRGEFGAAAMNLFYATIYCLFFFLFDMLVRLILFIPGEEADRSSFHFPRYIE